MAVVEFQDVSKQFTIHHERSRSFQEILVNLFRRSGGMWREQFWALRDVSFQIERGEILALIGANGSGKSTALKLISRILSPTSGSISVNGQVAALLELGTGFHPDLTGRENVFLNGSILGLGRKAVKRQLDKIIDFAGIERFIDVPVRNYSSGMLVRLGFAVATHMNAEILLVDEVLAVGDAAFQSKCYGHIAKLRESGVTIIFVSHNLRTVQDLGQKAIWLNDGHIAAQGAPEDVIASYKAWVWQLESKARKETELEHAKRVGSGEAEIVQVSFLDASGTPTDTYVTGDPFHVCLRYVAHERIKDPAFGIAILTPNGDTITAVNSAWSGYTIDAIEGEGEAQYNLDSLPLQPGPYELTCAIYDRNIVHAYDFHRRMYRFNVLPQKNGRADGLVFLPHTWEHYPDSEKED